MSRKLLNELREVMEDNERMKKYIKDTHVFIRHLRQDLWFDNRKIIEKVCKVSNGD